MEIKPLGEVGKPNCLTDEEWKNQYNCVGRDTMHVERLSDTIFKVRIHRRPEWIYCTAEEMVSLLLSMQVGTPVQRESLIFIPVKKLLPQKGLTLSQEAMDELFKDL